MLYSLQKVFLKYNASCLLYAVVYLLTMICPLINESLNRISAFVFMLILAVGILIF